MHLNILNVVRKLVICNLYLNYCDITIFVEMFMRQISEMQTNSPILLAVGTFNISNFACGLDGVV